FPSRSRQLPNRSIVRAFKDNLTRTVRNPGALQDVAQSHAGPLRIADSAELPLHTFDFWDQKHPAITGTLQLCNYRVRRHLTYLVYCHLELALDPALHF